MALRGKVRTLTFSFVLRRADERDDAACGELVSRAASRAEYARKVRFALHFLADSSPLELPPSYVRWVAEQNGSLLGLVQFDPTAGYVKYLFTEPEAQGRGIGSALLQAAERAIEGPTRLTALWVNDTGILWYMRRGYRISGGELEADWHGGPVVWIELEKPKLSG